MSKNTLSLRSTACPVVLGNLQSCTEQVITTPDHVRSNVWKHFGFDNTDCKIVDKDETALSKLTWLHQRYDNNKSEVSLMLTEAVEAWQRNKMSILPCIL